MKRIGVFLLWLIAIFAVVGGVNAGIWAMEQLIGEFTVVVMAALLLGIAWHLSGALR